LIKFVRTRTLDDPRMKSAGRPPQSGGENMNVGRHAMDADEVAAYSLGVPYTSFADGHRSSSPSKSGQWKRAAAGCRG
jgi:hypothetical protein